MDYILQWRNVSSKTFVGDLGQAPRGDLFEKRYWRTKKHKGFRHQYLIYILLNKIVDARQNIVH